MLTDTSSAPFHLCPSSRRDIDSLGRPKQGWSGGSGARSAPPQQQPDTAVPSALPLTTISLAAPCNGAAPATAAAFEKEWRRLRTHSQNGSVACIALLQSAGGAGFIKRRLSSGDLGPDLLGEMVEALTDATVAEPEPSLEEGAAAAGATPAAAGMTTRTLSHDEALACLDALAGTPRFALHWALLSREQRTATTKVIAAIVGAGGDGGKDAVALARVQKAYCA